MSEKRRILLQKRKLGKILVNYPDVIDKSKIRKQIIKSFNFKVPVAYIKLYDKKTKRRTKFIEELREFFFVSEAYFYLEPKESKLFGVILFSRFKDLLDVATYYAKRYNGQFDRFPDLSCVLFGTPFKKIEVSPSKKRIKELKTILSKYKDLFTDGYAIGHIIKAFTSKKPVTSIELTNKEPRVIKTFIGKLEQFFSISQSYSDPDLLEYVFSGIIFVSHFKNLLEVITYYSNKHNGVYDRFADLAGFILLNYPPLRIALYCFAERLKKHNFIK